MSSSAETAYNRWLVLQSNGPLSKNIEFFSFFFFFWDHRVLDRFKVRTGLVHRCMLAACTAPLYCLWNRICRLIKEAFFSLYMNGEISSLCACRTRVCIMSPGSKEWSDYLIWCLCDGRVRVRVSRFSPQRLKASRLCEIAWKRDFKAYFCLPNSHFFPINCLVILLIKAVFFPLPKQVKGLPASPLGSHLYPPSPVRPVFFITRP